MTTGLFFIYGLLSLLSGFIAGFLFTMNIYPQKELKKVLQHLVKKEGYHFGEWKHVKTFVDHHTRVVVKPNCETLYSLAFIRKKDGPYILKVPEISGYFSFTFINKSTDVCGYFTPRDVKGTGPQCFLISYDENFPDMPEFPGIVIGSRLCWIIGRFGVTNPGDIPVLNKVQDSLELMKLNEFLRNEGKNS